jgi:DUF1016 N-terminal domain
MRSLPNQTRLPDPRISGRDRDMQYTLAMARKRKSNEMVPASRSRSEPAPANLLEDLRGLIQSTRAGIAHAVNSALVILYWEVGHRIRTEVLKSERAAYGEQIVPTLSAQLVPDFGDGFSARNLFRMIRFAEVFPDREVVLSLSSRLGWSHFVELLQLNLLSAHHARNIFEFPWVP